eukprot:5892043-Pyramimonas_sp.AAC.1
MTQPRPATPTSTASSKMPVLVGRPRSPGARWSTTFPAHSAPASAQPTSTSSGLSAGASEGR